jgi:predicted small metal-binding protein
MASFKCRDAGLNCDFKCKNENITELIQIIGYHAANSHRMQIPLRPAEAKKVGRAIKS